MVIYMDMKKEARLWKKEDPYSARLFELNSAGKLANDENTQREYNQAGESWRAFLKRRGY